MEQIVGTACILRYGTAWLFELQKQHKWRQRADGTPVIGVGCIGGRLEHNERPRQALQREATEEIGCTVELQTPRNRILVAPDLSVRRLAPGEGDPLAALYWEEAKPGFIPGAKVAVYLGTPVGEPKPDDLPAVLCAPRPALSMIWAGGTIRELERIGCRLLERAPIPRDARLEPVGTVAVLGRLRHASSAIVGGLLGAGP